MFVCKLIRLQCNNSIACKWKVACQARKETDIFCFTSSTIPTIWRSKDSRLLAPKMVYCVRQSEGRGTQAARPRDCKVLRRALQRFRKYRDLSHKPHINSCINVSAYVIISHPSAVGQQSGVPTHTLLLGGMAYSKR